MRICETPGCEKKHAAKGFCIRHYYKWRYKTDPEYRQNQDAQNRKYLKSEKGQAWLKKYQKTHNSTQVPDFFRKYNGNRAWQIEGIEKMSKIYSTMSCGLSGEQACDLQEKILAQAEKRLKKMVK